MGIACICSGWVSLVFQPLVPLGRPRGNAAVSWDNRYQRVLPFMLGLFTLKRSPVFEGMVNKNRGSDGLCGN